MYLSLYIKIYLKNKNNILVKKFTNIDVGRLLIFHLIVWNTLYSYINETIITNLIIAIEILFTFVHD